MLKSIKYRIYPNMNQIEFLKIQFDSCRFIYNSFLEYRQVLYKNYNEQSSYYKDCLLLSEMKSHKNFRWLKKPIAQSLREPLKHLDFAYKMFFNKSAQLPKFHKKNKKQAITLYQCIKVKNNKLFITKLKQGIDIVLHKALPKSFKCVTISKTPSGKYYASFLIDETIKQLPKNNNKIGIDVGITNLIVTSSNKVFNNPKTYKKYEKKVKYLIKNN